MEIVNTVATLLGIAIPLGINYAVGLIIILVLDSDNSFLNWLGAGPKKIFKALIPSIWSIILLLEWRLRILRQRRIYLFCEIIS